MARLKEYYKKEVVPALMKQFGYTNTMQVPRLEKIIVNMGLGEAIQNVKIIDSAAAEIAAIAGPEGRSSPRPRSPSRPSSCARACPSAAWSRFASERMCEFSTAW